MSATAQGCTAIVTGGNRGIGRAFVEELLAAGAARVYCGARDVDAVPAELVAAGAVPVPLDVTDEESVAAAARTCADATVVINNAGLHGRDSLVLAADPAVARREMEVNYFGVLAMTRAFAPVLARNGGGAIVNVLSVAGAIPTVFMGGYSPAKSAALFLSVIARAELEPQGTSVTALVVGSVDTRMADHVEGEKEDPRDIAVTGLRAMARGSGSSTPTAWRSRRGRGTRWTRCAGNAAWRCSTRPAVCRPGADPGQTAVRAARPSRTISTSAPRRRSWHSLQRRRGWKVRPQPACSRRRAGPSGETNHCRPHSSTEAMTGKNARPFVESR